MKKLLFALALVTSIALPPVPGAKGGSGIDVSRDIRFRRVDGVTLRLNIYRDPSASLAPVLILAHGGEWRRGDRYAMEQEAKKAVVDGFVAVVPDYRLACHDGKLCGFNHPAPLKDLRKALDWVRGSIGSYGGDPDRVALLGSSAGGHLGQLLGTTGKPGQRVDVVVSWSGPSKLKMLRDGPGEKIVENYLGCSYEACSEDWHAASPIERVDRRAAPMLIVNSRTEDIPLKGAKQMVRELDSKRVPADLLVVEGSKHGTAYAGRVWDSSIAFIKDALG